MSTKSKEAGDEEKKPIVIKNATDLQRLKLEKLMKNPVWNCLYTYRLRFLKIYSHLYHIVCNIKYRKSKCFIPFSQDKPVIIPDGPKQKTLAPPPDFVRNVMGSSAGAGSGEFHVYRHLRRKEYARQKFIQEKTKKVLETFFSRYLIF